MKVTANLSLKLVALMALGAVLVVPWGRFYDGSVSLSQMLQPPSFQHPLGTDNLGRDLVVRVQSVLRDAVLPVWAVTAAASLLGFFCGGMLTLAGPRLREFVRVLVSAGVGVPIGILVFYAAVMTEVIRPSTLLVPLGSIIFLRSIHHVFYCYERDRLLGYWQASRSMGQTEAYRVFHYGLRRAWLPGLMRVGGFHLKVAVICEVGLSYLGFGIQEPDASFGNMLSSHFDSYLNGQFTVLLVVSMVLWLVSSAPEMLLSVGRHLASARAVSPPARPT